MDFPLPDKFKRLPPLPSYKYTPYTTTPNILWFFAILIPIVVAIGIGVVFVVKNFKRKHDPVIIVANILPTSESTPADPTADWKTYTLPGSIVSFRYPSDWILSDTCDNKFNLPICIESPDFNPDLLTSTWKIASSGAFMGLKVIPTKSLAAKPLAQYEGNCTGNGSGTCGYETIGGKPTIRIKEQADFKVSTETVHVQLSDKEELTVVYGNSTQNADNERPIFEQILTTMKFE